MNIFLSYIREFLKNIHTGLFLFCFSFAAVLIFLNYRYGIEPRILYNITNRLHRFAGFYLVYLAAFSIPYLFLFLVKGRQVAEWKFFLLLILLAPAIFALKVTFGGLVQFIQNNIEGVWGRYTATIINLPSRMIVVVIPLFFIWWLGKYDYPFWGATINNFNWKPYMLMLLCMVPLVAFASTQPDFLNTYPKVRQINFVVGHTNNGWLFKSLFEIAYGIDFITIELFFRGFLVLAFVRFVGQDAILPMAVFYCSIHFGKPLAECISSFIGGLLLGIVVYHTKSITGGLLIHVGLAWMMEIGAIIGLLLKNK